MSKSEKIDNRFQPPKNVSENDLPDILYGKEGEFSIDVSKVKESFTWFINMADFIKTTELKCKDCDLYPGCGRYPKAEQSRELDSVLRKKRKMKKECEMCGDKSYKEIETSNGTVVTMCKECYESYTGSCEK